MITLQGRIYLLIQELHQNGCTCLVDISHRTVDDEVVFTATHQPGCLLNRVANAEMN